MTITEEDDVTMTTTVGGTEVPAPPEGLSFTYLSAFPGLNGGGNLGEMFDASLAQAQAEAYAALAEEQAAFWAASQRVHARLDIYQHGRVSGHMAMPEPPAMTEALAPLRARLQEAAPVAESLPEPEEPILTLPEAREAALARFNAEHDAQDAREAEAAPEPAPGLARLPDGTLEGPDPTGPLVDSEPVPEMKPDVPAEVAEDATEAEPGTEDEEPAEAAGPEAPDDGEPAAEQDEAPAPVAEISDPAPQDKPDPTD